MSIWPVCPNCGAAAKTGSKFRIEPDVFEEEHEPRRGEVLKSAAHLSCITCTWKFPLWEYTVGDPNSWKPNAVDDDGKPWDPYKSEPWWTPATPLAKILPATS